MPARERQPPGGGRFDEAGDATRRTRLANERTYLEEAVSRAEFAPPDERLVALLSGVAAALGILLAVVLLTES